MLGRIESFLRKQWPLFSLGDPLRRGGLRLAVVSGGMGVHNKMICPCWLGNAVLPLLIVKFPRYPQYNYRLQAEYQALERVQTYLCEQVDAARVPRPLAYTLVDGLCVTVETAWRGRSLLAHLREHGEHYSAQLEKLALFAAWLANLHARSATPATPQQMQELVLAPLRGASEEFNLSAQERIVLEGLCNEATVLMESSPPPIVFNHNDLNMVNVLVDEHGDFASVIDWDAGGFGLPATDLFYFLMRFNYEASPEHSKDPLKSYQELFFQDSPVPVQPTLSAQSSVLTPRLWLRDYCRTTGLDPRWLPVLFPLGWIMHARNEKYLLGLHAQGQMLYGISAQVTPDAVDDDMSERGRFRARLCFYLNNLDVFIAANAWVDAI